MCVGGFYTCFWRDRSTGDNRLKRAYFVGWHESCITLFRLVYPT
jgi:hypothetical protein